MTKEHKDFPEIELIDFIESTSTIECFACKNSETLADDFTEALEYFYEEGWRNFKDQPYCKRCTNKLNKNKNNKFNEKSRE